MGNDDRIADNRENWDQRADIHADSRVYDVEAFVSDPTRISTVVRRDLAVLEPHLDGGIRGKSLLHLQCHIGTDTLSWVRLGAVEVHGVDFSLNSLAHARRIAKRAGLEATFVESDARTASSVVERAFDVVVTSTGTIVWLPDLDSWAHSIFELLRPGGTFVIRDDHPLMGAMQFAPWTVSRDYLSGGGGSMYEADHTYTDGPRTITQTRNHEWQHDLSEITGALLSAGLEIRALGEHPHMDWKPFPELVECTDGFRLPEGMPRIPLTFSVVARRPA